MAEKKGVELAPAGAGNYGAENITWLEGLEAVRHRPGMYIGDVGRTGLFVLCREVLDNSTDEAMGGYADRVTVRLLPDNVVEIEDNGRGIPVGIHAKTGRSALELVMTELHAGGKFDSNNYKVAAGLHGVGVSVVNALSDYTEVRVKRDGQLWFQRYERGIPQGDVKAIGAADGTGTIVTYLADDSIFTTQELDLDLVTKRMRELSYLVPTSVFVLENHRVEPPKIEEYHNKGGLAAFCEHMNKNKTALHRQAIHFQRVKENADGKGSNRSVEVEVAIQYNEGYHDTIVAFGNSIHNIHGGLHESGFKTGLTRAINGYARKKSILKEKEANLSGDDVREGLTAIISVKVSDPVFSSQAKERLTGPNFIEGAVNSVVGEGLAEWLDENPNVATRVVQKAITAAQAREAAKKAADLVKRKNALESDSLPGKLADCSEKDPRECEIFLVEGDSAGGCFSGDTQVALTDGRHVSFEELVHEQAAGQEHFVYTMRSGGQIGVERALHARVTKRDAEIVRVSLDNGEAITCTPDHRFMLRDGSYKIAAQLTPQDSLMPLYRKLSDFDGEEMAWNPSSKSWLFTHSLANNQHHDFLKMSDVVKMEDDVTRAREAVANYNHRIVAIETLTERIDVYDIEVPGTHNFALASGVFVHNSAKQGRDRRFQAILPLRGKIINVEKNRLDKILGNEEIRAMITAFGTGIADRVNYEELAEQIEHDQQELKFDLSGEASATLVGEVDGVSANGTAHADESHIENDGESDERSGEIFAAKDDAALDAERDDSDANLDDDDNDSKAKSNGVAKRNMRGGKVGAEFDLERLRYHRIIIMCDADVDGSHIRTLLLTFLFRYMRPLVEAGHIYIAKPPLYAVRKGKQLHYAYDDRERDRILAQSRGEVGRFKGLGEMNPEELWSTTMEPEKRLLVQVTMEDAATADEIFSILMGDAVEPRKEFIEKNAKLLDVVNDLDI